MKILAVRTKRDIYIYIYIYIIQHEKEKTKSLIYHIITMITKNLNLKISLR